MIAALVAFACIGFAAVNLDLLFSDSLRSDTYRQLLTDNAAGLAAMNWLVLALKLVGAGLAIVTIPRRPPFGRPAWTGTLLWAAFTTLAVYALGAVAEGVGLLTGATGHGAGIGLRDLVYVAFFLAFAGGFGVLAVSYHRRFGLPRRVVPIGAIGAPLLIGLVLFAAPALLARVGWLPALTG